MEAYIIKNREDGTVLCPYDVFTNDITRAVTFNTERKANTVARALNKRMEAFYKANDHSFRFMRGKRCNRYVTMKVPR